MRLWVQFLSSLSRLRIHCCWELWHRSQMWLRSQVAVALGQASGYSSNWTPSLGTSICHRCGPKKTKSQKTKKGKEKKKKEKKASLAQVTPTPDW